MFFFAAFALVVALGFGWYARCYSEGPHAEFRGER
jgi:hypothetical protein